MERASATVVALSLIGLIVSVAVGVSVVVSAVGEARRVHHLADLAALAASDIDRGVAPGHPCDFARQLTADIHSARVHCSAIDGVSRVSITLDWHGFSFTQSSGAEPFEP